MIFAGAGWHRVNIYIQLNIGSSLHAGLAREYLTGLSSNRLHKSGLILVILAFPVLVYPCTQLHYNQKTGMPTMGLMQIIYSSEEATVFQERPNDEIYS